jgi:hypothetical protein
MTASPRREFLALLPGRVRWLLLCHDRPAECKVCLRAIAQLLAEEMEFVLAIAKANTVAWYQAQMGQWACSLDQAEELQQMTCAACYREALGGPRPRLVVADIALNSYRLTGLSVHEVEPPPQGAAEFEDVIPPHWLVRGIRIAAFSVAALVLLSLACL